MKNIILTLGCIWFAGFTFTAYVDREFTQCRTCWGKANGSMSEMYAFLGQGILWPVYWYKRAVEPKFIILNCPTGTLHNN